MVHIGNGKRQEIMIYDVIVEAIDRKLTSDAKKSGEDHLLVFKEVVGHRENGQNWDARMK
eukprot:10154059-Ditylum_brightwellii.AAC.1